MIKVFDLCDALTSLCPNSSFTIKNGIVDWVNIPAYTPTEEQIQAKIAELQAAEPMRLLRQQRDQLIAQTDWWVLPDRTATQAQLDYRQALRDLPQNSSPELDGNGNLINVNWPEQPE